MNTKLTDMSMKQLLKFRAVLFDLDGTLLESRMEEALLPQYFKRFSARMAQVMPAQEFINSLMHATQAMIENDGRATNAAVFAERFFPSLNVPREVVEPIVDEFYAQDFPLLRECTSCKEDARLAVQAAFDAGCEVVIATNPLFPFTAVQQRLAWAGVADFPFKLITTYENSRACKPNLLYYTQIFEEIGQPAESCLVVGDEAWDMVAVQLGCQTFLVESCATKPDVEDYHPTYRGSLRELTALLSGE